MGFKRLMVVGATLMILSGCNNNQQISISDEKEAMGEIVSNGKYETDKKNGVAWFIVPDVSDAKFGKQVLNNTFEINGLRVNHSNMPIEEKSEDPIGSGYNSYNQFAVLFQNDYVKGIRLEPAKGILMKELLKNWGEPYRKVSYSEGQTRYIFDTSKDDYYHVEVVGDEDVYNIFLLSGEVAEKDARPTFDVLSKDFKTSLFASNNMNIAGFSLGMSREILVSKFGMPNDLAIIDGTEKERYGDVAVDVIFNIVQSVYIAPENITLDELTAAWGKPSEKEKARDEASYPRYIYKDAKYPDMTIEVGHHKGKVMSIEKLKK